MRHLSRILAFQYYNPFKRWIEQLRDSELTALVAGYSKKWGNQISVPENLEGIFYRSIVIDPASHDKDVNIEYLKYTIDWDRLASEIKYNYASEKSYEHLKSEANLVIILLEKAMVLLEAFFPIKEFGLPNYQVLSILMNFLLDKNFLIVPENIVHDHWVRDEEDLVIPYIDNSLDTHGTLKDMEIQYLRSKIKDLKPDIDIDYEMWNDGFAYQKEMMGQVLKMNTSVSLRIEPTLTKKHLTGMYKDTKTSVFDEVMDSFQLASGEIGPELTNNCKKLKTIASRAELYMDLRFNQKKSYAEISQILNKKGVRDDILELAEAVGLTEESKMITSRHKGDNT